MSVFNYCILINLGLTKYIGQCYFKNRYEQDAHSIFSEKIVYLRNARTETQSTALDKALSKARVTHLARSMRCIINCLSHSAVTTQSSPIVESKLS